MQLKTKKLHPDAILPKYAHPGEDLAADLHALNSVSIFPGQRLLVRTGIAFEFPPGVGAIVTGRSGLFIKQGLIVHLGTIDQGYRGEMSVLMFNADRFKTIHIEQGDRIAQMRLVYQCTAEFEEVAELGNSTRGEGGFGSTGISNSEQKRRHYMDGGHQQNFTEKTQPK